MFVAAVISTLVALSAVAPSVSALPSNGVVRNVHRSVPSQFQKRDYVEDSSLLEEYSTYAARYQLFDCEDQHNTTFWDACCHPLLKDESEDSLPEQCTPPTGCDEPTSSVHTSALPTSTHVDQPTSTEKPTSSEKPATTSAIAKPAPPATTSTSDPITSAPETTSKPPHTTHSTSKAAPTTSVASDGSPGGDWRTGGVATYFYQEGNAGACGQTHSDDDLIVAIDIAYYGNTGEVSSYCGKKVLIVNLNNGHQVTALIADVCPTCDTENSLDMSLGTFKALDSNLSDGEFPIKYQVLS